MKLEGKRVLITGGSSGIGFAIAQALLIKRAKVAVTGRRPAVLSAAVDELRKGGWIGRWDRCQRRYGGGPGAHVKASTRRARRPRHLNQ